MLGQHLDSYDKLNSHRFQSEVDFESLEFAQLILVQSVEGVHLLGQAPRPMNSTHDLMVVLKKGLQKHLLFQ